jgi:hypothetical protein
MTSARHAICAGYTDLRLCFVTHLVCSVNMLGTE